MSSDSQWHAFLVRVCLFALDCSFPMDRRTRWPESESDIGGEVSGL